ncbi:MAG: hypothetical protein J5772_05410 [Clostridia bacterium]|nr:hypothetical protein [Clostridia bacterium]MBR5718013.1 hypothetical protein [Clostridia bacterium]
MEETKTPKTEKKPSAAALKAALAQLEEQESGKKKNTVIFRILAFVCWALAAVAMYLPYIGLNLPFGAVRVLFLDPNNWLPVIIDVIVAGILCVVGARLWIYANHIHPTKSHNKVVQFIWNQLGVIMAGIILAPLAIILIARRKDLPQKTKTIVAAVLALVFVGASAGSADYHPVTQDQVNDVVQQLTEEAEGYGFTDGDGVRWTKYGNCYHIFSDCQSIRNSNPDNCTDGSIEEAVESNRARLCTFCIKRYEEAKANGEVPGKIELTEKIGDLIEDLTETGDDGNGNE